MCIRDRVKFEPNAKTNSISKQVNFDPITENQVNFDTHSSIKSILMPRHKTQLISVLTPKTGVFRPLHKNQINADPPYWNGVIFDKPHNNQINFILHWNHIKFDPPHWNQANLDHPHKNQVTLHAQPKNMWFSPRVQIKQVNFDHPHNNQINFILTVKSSQARSPTLRSNQFRPLFRKSCKFPCSH